MTNSAEVGVGWVRLVPSLKGFKQAASRGLSEGLRDPASKAGKDAGGDLGDGIAGGVDAKQGKFRSSVGKLAGVFKAGLAGVGVAAGLALVGGLSGALDREDAAARFQAQLGGDPAKAAELGKVAGDSFLEGFGSSLEDNQLAVAQIDRRGLADSTEELEELTRQAVLFSDVFGGDMQRNVDSVAKLVANDLVGSGEEGFDLLTRAAQRFGVEIADVTDLTDEYGTSAEQLGLSGQVFLGAVSQIAEAGGFNIDKAADLFKELNIRIRDGSDASTEAVAALGLGYDELISDLEAGGPRAESSLQQIFDNLMAIEDPVERNQLGVALMGTQWEDLGDTVGAVDFATARDELGDLAGATDDLGVVNETASKKIETFKRQVLAKLVDFIGGTAIPKIEELAAFLGPHLQTAVETLGPIIEDIRLGMTGFIAAFSGEGVTSDGFVGFMEELGVTARDFVTFLQEEALPAVQSVIADLTAAWEEHGPQVMEILGQVEGIIVDVLDFIGAAVALWVAAFTFVWDNWGEDITRITEATLGVILEVIEGGLDWLQGLIRTATAIMEGDWDEAWEGIKQATEGIWSALFAVIEGGIDAIFALIGGWLDGELARMKDLWSDITGSVEDEIDDLLDFFGDLAGKVTRKLSGLEEAFKKPFREAFNSIRALWNDTIGGFSVDIPGALGFSGVSFSIPRMHSGGIFEADGGDEGLALLQTGEGVFTREQMAALAPVGGAGGEGAAPAGAVVVLQADNLDQSLKEWLRRTVRIEGRGDVQLAFGTAA